MPVSQDVMAQDDPERQKEVTRRKGEMDQITGALVRRRGVKLAEKIREKRNARGWSQADLAEKAGTSQQTVNRIEQGVTVWSRALPAILRELGLEEEVLSFLTAEERTLEEFKQELGEELETAGRISPVAMFPRAAVGRPIPKRDPLAEGGKLPVYGSAEGGEAQLILSFEPVEYVVMPEPLDGVKGAYGMFVSGDSMSPAFEPGDTLLVHPHLPPRAHDDVVIWKVVDGETHLVVKRLLRRTEDYWKLRQFNPQLDFDLPRDEWTGCHLIVGKYARR